MVKLLAAQELSRQKALAERLRRDEKVRLKQKTESDLMERQRRNDAAEAIQNAWSCHVYRSRHDAFAIIAGQRRTAVVRVQAWARCQLRRRKHHKWVRTVRSVKRQRAHLEDASATAMQRMVRRWRGRQWRSDMRLAIVSALNLAHGLFFFLTMCPESDANYV